MLGQRLCPRILPAHYQIQYNHRMQTFSHLGGVYAAAITPINPDFSPDYSALPALLEFLHDRGCHGALLLGTTGEGPSFAPAERLELMRSALHVRRLYPDFRLLAGTGTPSLSETIELTKAAFEIGMDGVVVLPPYYFRQAAEEGLHLWFSQVIQEAVPPGKVLLAYHIPRVSGVPLSIELIVRLKSDYPDRFAGIKDSSGDPEHAARLGETFGRELLILNGSDQLFSLALQCGAMGCITALGNLFSPDLRQVWDGYQRSEDTGYHQGSLIAYREVAENYQPFPPLVKALLARLYHFPFWTVRPPLLPLPNEAVDEAEAALRSLWNND